MSRAPGRPFEPGDRRINRGGRPKGAAETARKILESGTPDEIVEDMIALYKSSKPGSSNWWKAAEWLSDRSLGKAAQVIEAEVIAETVAEGVLSLDGLNLAELRTLQQVLARQNARAVVDGEIIEPPALPLPSPLPAPTRAQPAPGGILEQLRRRHAQNPPQPAVAHAAPHTRKNDDH